ncbi:MAG: methylenetetrahydrofolate reductase [Candidatus Thermoplasmatota archaeon]|nr:methylenetetrahydrofolate reductase [Candidatus Thermoplasmatota archaeon]MCL5793652.1 methylenetetrahydrofolate reductase [Candidatus Thermoplasmatota archaeon]
MKIGTVSDLSVIRSVEVVPNRVPGKDDLHSARELLRDYANVMTCPENPMGSPGIDPVASLIDITSDTNIIPVPHISPRDKNAVHIMSQVLTGLKFGIRNFFVIGGDRISDKYNSREVRELDVLGTIRTIVNSTSMMKDFVENVAVGTAFNPYRENETEFLMKKSEAGSRFFISQILAGSENVDFAGLKAAGLNVIPGFMPLKRKSSLEFLEKLGVPKSSPGMRRLSEAEDVRGESIKLILDTYDEIRAHVRGIHIMSMGDYRTAGEILESV